MEPDRYLHIARHTPKGHPIYLGTAIFLTLALLLLPVIQIDVGIRAHGMIQPERDRITLHTPVSGILLDFPLQDNLPVEAGDTLLRIDPEPIHQRIQSFERRIRSLKERIQDLETLQRNRSLTESLLPRLNTGRYRHSLMELLRRQDQIRQEKKILEAAYQRNRKLFRNQHATLQQKQESRNRFQKAESEYAWSEQEKRYQWSRDLDEYRSRIEDIRTSLQQARTDLKDHTVTAPVAGTIQNPAPLRRGLFVPQNLELASLSPAGKLHAELYIDPADIGLIEEGMKTRLRIDALDHREWGILEGVVTDIPDDVTVRDDGMFYRLRVRLSRNWMELPGGYRRELLKGMPLQARLIVSRRTLFQLLFDRLDDWLNPQWNSENS